MLATLTTSLALVAAAVAADPSNPLSFDGRIPTAFPLTDFDSYSTSPYDAAYVLGRNTKWSEVIDFPPNTSSGAFTSPNYKAFEIKVTDASIFQSGDASSAQLGFRRSELLPSKFNVSSLDSSTGVKTFHFSVKANPAKPLNYSHEYQLVFQEDSSYSTNQFVLKTGTIIGQSQPATPQLYIQGNQRSAQTIYQVAFDQDVWHNFAVKQDFNANTITVYYSTNTSPLAAKTSAVYNDNSGNGQFHFGILKKPTGNVQDVTKEGYQESGIDERIQFAGVFQENSASGGVSLGGSSTVKRGHARSWAM